jgi:hypothetical protein
MQFPHIIELIDEYLDRLIEVRRLLADLDLPAANRKAPAVAPSRAAQLKSKATGRLAARSINRASKRRFVPRKTRKPLVQKLKAENLIEKSTMPREATLAAVYRAPPATVMPRELGNQNAEQRIMVHPRKNLPSKRRIAPLKSSVKTGVLALGGTIPTGPIVVSAHQIRIEHSLRQQVTTVRRDPFSSPNTLPLTAELLTQRWIQGSQPSAR